jgi:hypothetical protein
MGHRVEHMRLSNAQRRYQTRKPNGVSLDSILVDAMPFPRTRRRRLAQSCALLKGALRETQLFAPKRFIDPHG